MEMSNELIADITMQMTMLERCVAEVVCDPSVNTLELQSVILKLHECEQNGICELLEPCHSCLSTDINVKLDCLINDKNILNQVKRNIIISKTIVEKGDDQVFKKNMISCVLNDLSECYVDKNISLHHALVTLHETTSENVQAEFEKLESVYSNTGVENGIGSVFMLLQDIILNIN